MKRKLLVAILLFGCFVVIGFCVRQFTLPMGFGDEDKYLVMAQAPGRFASVPWGYRVAVPYAASALSKALSIPLKTAFVVLQLSMFGVTLTLLVRWMSDGLASRNFVTGLSASLFVFSYPGIYNLHNIVHVGFGEHLFLILGCMAIYSNRFTVLCLVMAASCFVKESVGFLLIPTYFAFAMLFSAWGTALLRTACLIAVFLKKFSRDRQGRRLKNYYTSESVGIATGMLITALHNAGVATLTHTPSPMRFLNEILSRPADERPFLLLVAGFAAENATVPDIQRQNLSEILTTVA